MREKVLQTSVYKIIIMSYYLCYIIRCVGDKIDMLHCDIWCSTRDNDVGNLLTGAM